MSAQADKIRIGAFVLGALALALVAVALIGSGRLFSTQLRVVMFFESSLRGLSAGSPVVFRGVPVGRVSAIRMSGDADTREIFIPVYVDIDTAAMKDLKSAASAFPSSHSEATHIRILAQQGLRARLNNQSLLTGMLLIELDFFPDAPRREAFMPMPVYDSLPVIPTVPSPVEAAWQRVSELPVDKLAQLLMDILVKVDAALDNPALKTLPANLDATLAATRSTLDVANAAVQTFDRLAASLTSATGMVDKEVPATLARVRQTADAYAALAAQFERDLESLRGVVGPNTATMLEFTRAARELGEAAKAVRGLAGQLERNPESLLLGKGAVRK